MPGALFPRRHRCFLIIILIFLLFLLLFLLLFIVLSCSTFPQISGHRPFLFLVFLLDGPHRPVQLRAGRFISSSLLLLSLGLHHPALQQRLLLLRHVRILDQMAPQILPLDRVILVELLQVTVFVHHDPELLALVRDLATEPCRAATGGEPRAGHLHERADLRLQLELHLLLLLLRARFLGVVAPRLLGDVAAAVLGVGVHAAGPVRSLRQQVAVGRARPEPAPLTALVARCPCLFLSVLVLPAARAVA